MTERMEARPARKIRWISHWSNASTPKQVKDARLDTSIRWIRAIHPHDCAAGKRCRQGKVIKPQQTYAQVIWPGRIRLQGARSMPQAQKFHLGCVPKDLYPLMRILLPVRTRHLPRRRRKIQ